MIQNSGSNGKGKSFSSSKEEKKTCEDVKPEKKRSLKKGEKQVTI